MIVITGGAGFIGSCILAKFNERGRRDIIVVDHLQDDGPVDSGNGRFDHPHAVPGHFLDKQKNLDGKDYRQYLEKQDFLDGIVRDCFEQPIEGIIHMGACSSTTLLDAPYFEQNNFQYTKSLAEWAVRHGARFIYASSAATYGDGSCGYKDDDETIRKCRPLNLYGLSKQKFDAWVLDQGYQDRFVGLKFFNVYGPNEYHKEDMRSVVAKAFHKVRDEGRIRLFKSYRPEYADGEQKRDFIYVKDAVDIVMHFWDHPEIHGIYNVGTGRASTWNDLAQAIFKALGKNPRIEYFDMPEGLAERYQYFTQADMSKLQQVGYTKAFTPLDDAVSDYVEYLQTNKRW